MFLEMLANKKYFSSSIDTLLQKAVQHDNAEGPDIRG